MKKRVTWCEVKNGKLSLIEKEALKHDNSALSDWYKTHTLHGDITGSGVEWEDLIDWLSDNKKEVEEILSKI